MKDYIFSTVAAACVLELMLEFSPFIKDATVKKYLRYIFALVLSLCIISPFSGPSDAFDAAFNLDTRDETHEGGTPTHLYFENASFLCECSETGVPIYESVATADMYISECCFGIIENAKLAVSSKLSIPTDDIRLGISFDLTDISKIEIICAYLDVNSRNTYLISDAFDYLENTLGCKVYKTEVRR